MVPLANNPGLKQFEIAPSRWGFAAARVHGDTSTWITQPGHGVSTAVEETSGNWPPPTWES